MAISQFPRFKTVVLSDKKIIENTTGSFLPYSDFNFVSLFTWGANRSSSFSSLEGNLMIRLRDYTGTGFIYSILGDQKIQNTVTHLLASDGIKRLDLVPEEVTKDLNDYRVLPQRDEADYVYNLESLLALQGSGYRNFRRALSNFESKNHRLKVVVRKIESDNYPAKTEAADLAREWRRHKARAFRDFSNEYFAIKRALRFSSELGIDILGVYSHKHLIGFTITESLGDWAILHFEKTIGGIPGLGAFLKFQTFKYLHESGHKKLNYEQDLGIAGLRQAKQALCPQGYLRKFSVTK